jgi:ABC-type uncharacterized transport system substrate-binding protein
LGLQLNVYNISDENEFDQAFAIMIERRTDALIITTAPMFSRHKERLVELAERHALPAVYFGREFAHAGGLMSYGSSFPDAYRQTGVYAGRVLKGEKPSDLPILQPTKFDLAGQPDRRVKKRPWRRRSVRTCSTSLSNLISRGSVVFANAYMRRTSAISTGF